MKKSSSIIFASITFLLSSTYVIGQNEVDQRNFNLIIKASSDTIKSPVIKTKTSESNEDQVSFIQDKSVIVVKSADLISYFDGNSKYYSESIKEKGGKKLIKYIVTGPIYLGQSYSKSGKSTFYLKLKDDSGLVNLELKKIDIDGFLREYINDFEQFKNKYNKKIYYDYKSLAEFASAYNAYKVPETYVPLKFSNPEAIEIGFYVSINSSQIKFENTPIKVNAPTTSTGFIFTDQFSRVVSLDLLSALNFSAFKYNNEEVKINTFEITPSLGFSYFLNEKLCIKLNVGPSFLYNFNSKVTLTNERRSVLIRGINFGYSAGMSVILMSKYAFFINYQNYGFKTKNFDPAGLESAREGKLASCRFGCLYNF